MKFYKILIIYFILILILVSGCIQNKKITKIKVDINGMKNIIVLSKSISIPLNKIDAELIKNESGCYCEGELILKEDYWFTSCCENIHDCSLRINNNNGNVVCMYFG